MAKSPVSIVGRWYDDHVGGSFQQPLTDPGPLPTDAPTVCIQINVAWQEVLAGCALQVMMPYSWAAADDAALNALLDNAHLLFLAVATAGECHLVESGTLSLTIPAGDATVTGTITFTGSYTAAPVVVVSCNDITLDATWSDVSTTQCTAHLTAAVPVTTDTTATISYMAQ